MKSGGKRHGRGRGSATTTPPGRSRHPIQPDEPDPLQRKYRLLRERYDALVQKYQRSTRSALAVVRLGWWALRTSASGLALVGRDGVELSNPRWQEFDRPADGDDGWERLEAADGRTFASLRDVALAEAADVLSTKAPPRTSRFRRMRSQQVLEIRSERVRGDTQTVAVIAHDVTAELQAEAELRLSREALHHRDRLQVIGQLASGVAHDLNNALNVMRMRLELLRRDSGNGPEHEAQIAAFAQIVDAAAERVARMQDFSRKQIDATTEPVDLRRAIQEAMAFAETQFEQHSLAEGRHFRVVCDVPELPPVRANIAELEHLFVNLLLNARDAMPTGGTIAVGASREGEFAVVSVRDEGTGIPERNLERIFESFFTTKGSRGTGLGLAMARGTMARLGGTIRAVNRDRGAEFILRFPLSLDGAASRPAPRVHAPQGRRIAALRVLLVDDDADCLDVTRAVLEAEHMSVEAARSGTQALALLREERYDVLLCDVGMPAMSGWEVAQEARRLRPSLRIYMVTGWASEFSSADPRRKLVNGVLGKPLDLDALRSALEEEAGPPQLDDQANA